MPRFHPYAKTVKKKTLKTLPVDTPVVGNPVLIEQPQPVTLSRGQRKRQKRKERFVSKQNLVLQEQELEAKSKAKDEILTSFSESLLSSMSVISTNSKTNAAATIINMKKEMKQKRKIGSTKTQKGRQRLLLSELGHLQAVNAHPSFMTNPLQTLRQHLTNTLVKKDE